MARLIFVDAAGNRVKVFRSFSGAWMTGTVTNGGHHRVKSPALPPRKTRAEAEADLRRYAPTRKDWSTAELA